MITLEIAKPDYAPELAAIYKPYVENTTISFEYRAPSAEEFAERIKATLIQYPFIAAFEDGAAAGYAYAHAFIMRPAYDWSAEVSIYVKEGHTGNGLGSRLYRELERYLRRQNITNLNACITYPNDASIAFHEKNGYVKNAHFHKCGFKLGKWLDMIWMEKCIAEHSPQPEKVIPFSMLADIAP